MALAGVYMGRSTVIELDIERDVMINDWELTKKPICMKLQEGVLLYLDFLAKRLRLSRSELVREILLYVLSVHREDFLLWLEGRRHASDIQVR